MSMIFHILGAICGLVTFVAYIFVVIEAFKDEVWKGIACLLCGLYLLYYVITEWANLYFNDIPVGLIYIVAAVLGLIFDYLAR